METKNELANVEKNELSAGSIDSVLGDISEELDGLGGITFDTVKIPSGGGLAFEVPGDDPDNPDIEREIIGVVLLRHAANGYWKDAFGGENNQPDCYSGDGKVGVDRLTGLCQDCDTCPRNQFKEDGSGKDCKNMQNLYIVREGEMFPIKLVLPPTSIKNLRDYVSKRLLFRGKKLGQVVTGITLSKAENRQGIKYAVAQFTKKRDLSPQEIAELEPLKALVAQAVNKQKEQPPADYPAVEDAALPFEDVD